MSDANVAPMSSDDAAELAARRAHDERMAAKYRGWKPLVLWYTFWGVLLTISAFWALGSSDGPGAGSSLIVLVVAALCFLYARYLYRGGRRRVWFFIF